MREFGPGTQTQRQTHQSGPLLTLPLDISDSIHQNGTDLGKIFVRALVFRAALNGL
ncbi:MAG: hypothetical protein GVY11_05795 [Gammaproteobacteria bacterium]|nr:hypothetical protein [Gammaproteobacteria bacterium]